MTAGTFAGAASLVIGHPFDTIKVTHCCQLSSLSPIRPCIAGLCFWLHAFTCRSSYKVSQNHLQDSCCSTVEHLMQSKRYVLCMFLHQSCMARPFANKYVCADDLCTTCASPCSRQPLPCCMQTIAEGGAQSLFRGMGAPFATVAFYNAILFAARGQMESMLAHADGDSFVACSLLISAIVQPVRFVATCAHPDSIHRVDLLAAWQDLCSLSVCPSLLLPAQSLCCMVNRYALKHLPFGLKMLHLCGDSLSMILHLSPLMSNPIIKHF